MSLAFHNSGYLADVVAQVCGRRCRGARHAALYRHANVCRDVGQERTLLVVQSCQRRCTFLRRHQPRFQPRYGHGHGQAGPQQDAKLRLLGVRRLPDRDHLRKRVAAPMVPV